MRRLTRIELLAVFPIVFLLQAAGPAAADGNPLRGKTVALVSWLQGAATVRATPTAPAEPLALFAPLAAGAVIETSPKAAVIVVFFDGQRLTFGGSSRVAVRRSTLHAEGGSLRRLAPIPAIVDLAPLLRDGAARRQMPAARIRGETTPLPWDVRETRARKSLADAAQRSGEPDLLQLLAEVDRRLAEPRPLSPSDSPSAATPSTSENREAQALLDRGDEALKRGDPVLAQESFRRAEAIFAAADAESLERATALHKLGIVALGYSDFDEAEELLRRSLALREKRDPGGLAAAAILHALGILAMARKDDPAAIESLERALTLYRQRDPDNLGVANTLSELAKPARRRGDFAAAEGYYRQALAIRQRSSPGSLRVASSFINLGILAEERGRLRQAESYFRRALAIAHQQNPEGPTEALVLLNLAEVRSRRGFRRESANLDCRAMAFVEKRRGALGGTALARTQFAATSTAYYHECLEARLQAGQPTEAFRALEMGRARVLLEQLAARDLTLAPALAPEITRERQALDTAYDQAQEQLSRLPPNRDAAESENLHRRLHELYAQQQELAAKAKATSPGSAAVRYPQPLDLASARRALDPGTLLLAYSVGTHETVLFVVSPERAKRHGRTAFRIPIGEEALRDAIRAFRTELQDTGSDLPELTRQAQELYDLLLRPAERQLAGAARLLISPDGPLHTLPFAALVHDGVFLAEWKPVHSVLSATVYQEIRKSRHPSLEMAGSEIIAFGDPLYPPPGADRAAVPEVATAQRRGLSLTPLPSSRDEVLGIAALFPKARTFLGAEATEENVKALASRARILHFACHGWLDARYPLNSALAFSLPEHPAPGQENGLLQAWEIFESLRLDADLVTLSACDSGLGKEMGGEGLMGLARAFQYAGARSVVASLWSVADESTAELMRRFYGYLRQGKSKDEALRAAQVDLIHGPEATSHPYYWAAFELTGDWR